MERREGDIATGSQSQPAPERQSAAEPQAVAQPQQHAHGAEAGVRSEPLLAGQDTEELLRRWESIQIGFVDEPRRAVQEADGLVAEVIQRIAETFSEERSRLEGQWSRGEEATDELRLALQRYRSFFQRLLST